MLHVSNQIEIKGAKWRTKHFVQAICSGETCVDLSALVNICQQKPATKTLVNPALTLRFTSRLRRDIPNHQTLRNYESERCRCTILKSIFTKTEVEIIWKYLTAAIS